MTDLKLEPAPAAEAAGLNWLFGWSTAIAAKPPSLSAAGYSALHAKIHTAELNLLLANSQKDHTSAHGLQPTGFRPWVMLSSLKLGWDLAAAGLNWLSGRLPITVQPMDFHPWETGRVLSQLVLSV